ncbi:ABC transporter G family member 20 [Orchesella cincta]|uniref:ABC transporter G family member 20 n=1 Tax=Orchesella cincta TaxID=48709 RepID=A0A1D2MM88_ORCCI|nr:ABC transporter G family member 20 [Orchesella cincta]
MTEMLAVEVRDACKSYVKGTVVLNHMEMSYIEEARRADTIGLMRNGRLLAEDSPSNLLARFDVPLLEDIVLELCRQDHKRMKENKSVSTNGIRNGNNNGSLDYPRPVVRVSTGSMTSFIPGWTSLKSNDIVAESTGCDCVVVGFQKYPEHLSDWKQGTETSENAAISPSNALSSIKNVQLDRIHSLIRRNCIAFVRNIPFLFMLVIFPALQTAIIASTLGGDPKNMSIAVVNEELPNWKSDCSLELSSCGAGHYSCRYLKRLEDDNLKLVPFETKEVALKEIQEGNLHYGILTIPKNYTQFAQERDIAGNFPLNETLDGSKLSVNLDYSNYVASLLITKKLFHSLESYAMELGKDCGKSPEEYKVPLKYRKPIYGREESEFTDYVVPGALTMILFLVPMCSCGLAFVGDKCQGTMDRSRVAGCTTFEMMVSFFITDGMIIIAQILISTSIILFGYDFRIEGSYALYGMMCLLTGITGQSWGFVLGLICPDEASLLITAFSMHFPMLVAGGIIWPLEGVPLIVRYVSNCFPVTASLLSMRSIVARGEGLFSMQVWPGVAILCIWITLAWTFAAMKYKSLSK